MEGGDVIWKGSVGEEMKDKIRIFKLNGSDYIAAKNLGSAMHCLAEHMGCDLNGHFREEYVDGPFELSEEAMQKLKIRDDDGKVLGTFKEVLDQMVRDGEVFPCYFASSEF